MWSVWRFLHSFARAKERKQESTPAEAKMAKISVLGAKTPKLPNAFFFGFWRRSLHSLSLLTFEVIPHRRFLTLHNENFFTPFVAGRFSYQPAMMVVANNISFWLSEVRTTSLYFCNNCIFMEYYFLKLLCYSISLIVWTTWSGELSLRFVQGWYVSCSALWRQIWLVFSKMWLL